MRPSMLKKNINRSRSSTYQRQKKEAARSKIDEPLWGHQFSGFFAAWCFTYRLFAVVVGCECLLVRRLLAVVSACWFEGCLLFCLVVTVFIRFPIN
jgi:hypothetical protein